jgi:hypothetical protein
MAIVQDWISNNGMDLSYVRKRNMFLVVKERLSSFVAQSKEGSCALPCPGYLSHALYGAA